MNMQFRTDAERAAPAPVKTAIADCDIHPARATATELYPYLAKRWHAHLDTHCIEGGKTTDTPRRKLVKTLEKKKDQFAVIELKSDRRQAFFDWLDDPI